MPIWPRQHPPRGRPESAISHDRGSRSIALHPTGLGVVVLSCASASALTPGGLGDIDQLTRHLDAAGWERAYVCDHFMPYAADGLPPDGPMLEGWTVLAALGGRTAFRF